jgi:hypothetical protein
MGKYMKINTLAKCGYECPANSILEYEGNDILTQFGDFYTKNR